MSACHPSDHLGGSYKPDPPDAMTLGITTGSRVMAASLDASLTGSRCTGRAPAAFAQHVVPAMLGALRRSIDAQGGGARARPAGRRHSRCNAAGRPRPHAARNAPGYKACVLLLAALWGAGLASRWWSRTASPPGFIDSGASCVTHRLAGLEGPDDALLVGLAGGLLLVAEVGLERRRDTAAERLLVSGAVLRIQQRDNRAINAEHGGGRIVLTQAGSTSVSVSRCEAICAPDPIT